MQNCTRNEWRRCQTTLETSEKDAKTTLETSVKHVNANWRFLMFRTRVTENELSDAVLQAVDESNPENVGKI
jgi:hypothetical protein